MARVQLQSLSKRYGDTIAVSGVSLDIAQGEFIVLLGPSGCGKTTTLRMLAGFIAPTEGQIRIGEQDVTRIPPWRRNTGLVFQSYALFPHMTAAENVAFGLEMRKLSKPEIAVRVREALEMVRLGALGDRLPRQLSGGQQQRVALARALAVRPDVLLLDEPLSNLDAKLRAEVRVEIRELQQRLGLTTVMVTHDQEEALTMADRLVVMAEGRVRQIGSQRDLYERPADRFVADFVGRSNFLNGTLTGDRQFTTTGSAVIHLGARDVGLRAGQGATFAIRPEQLTLATKALAYGPAAGFNCLTGVVALTSYLGAGIDVHVVLPGGERMTISIANRAGLTVPSAGDTVKISWPENGGLIFAQDERR
jgi:putative spermidine/putrescine transport system ATP-binding protein